MSHTLHELQDEFPDDRALLHELKLADGHFQRISEEYHDINRTIHRIEAEAEHASDERLEELKKQRLGKLDEVAVILSKAKSKAG